jgi:cytochrome c553
LEDLLRKSIFNVSAILLLALISVSCGSKKKTYVQITGGGGDGTTSEKNTGSVLDYDNVKSIFKSRCNTCHDSSMAPADWMSYAKISSYLKLKPGEMEKRLNRKALPSIAMPQASSAQAKAFTEEERQVLLSWLKSGAVEKASTSGKDAPPTDDKDSDAPPTEPDTPEGKVKIDIIIDDSIYAQYAAKCATCHQNTGNANVFGQNESYLYSHLINFKNQTEASYRKSSLMNLKVKDLSDNDIASLSKYISEQKRPDQAAPIVVDAQGEPVDTDFTKAQIETIKSGKAVFVTCAGCHSEKAAIGGNPKVIWQDQTYLKDQLKAFYSEARLGPGPLPPTYMKMMISGNPALVGTKEDQAAGRLNEKALDDLTYYLSVGAPEVVQEEVVEEPVLPPTPEPSEVVVEKPASPVPVDPPVVEGNEATDSAAVAGEGEVTKPKEQQ